MNRKSKNGKNKVRGEDKKVPLEKVMIVKTLLKNDDNGFRSLQNTLLERELKKGSPNLAHIPSTDAEARTMEYAKTIMEGYAERYVQNSREQRAKKIEERLEIVKSSKVHKKGDSIDMKLRQVKERRENPEFKLKGKYDKPREPIPVKRPPPLKVPFGCHSQFSKPSNSKRSTPGPGEYHQTSTWITPTHNLKFYS